MTHTHAVPSGTPHRAGQCAWIFDWEDVHLECEDPAEPGREFCASHPDVRRFGPVTVTIPEATA